MTSYDDILKALTRAIWGYIFLCFNFTFNTGAGIFNILPTFIGYLLFMSVVKLLQNSIKEISLLKMPLIILTIWSIADGIVSIAGVSVGTFLPIVSLIVSILNMYFVFQFLTNLAYIAQRCQYEGCTFDKKLIFFRTVQTILLTISTILTMLISFLDLEREIYLYTNIILALIMTINSLCIIITLSRLKKNLIKPEELRPIVIPSSGTVPMTEGDMPTVAPATDPDIAPAEEGKEPPTALE